MREPSLKKPRGIRSTIRPRVVLVDDDKDVCSTMKEFLSKEGYSVEAVTRPLRAIERIREFEPHVVILDLKMPGKDGAQILEGIRGFDPDVSVIILTGYPSLDSAVETLRMGAFDYLKKPVTMEQIKSSLREALDSKGILLEHEEKINLKIGGKIRLLRKERELTQQQLARRTNLSLSLISQIERAESAASISTLYKLSRALQVRLKDLFEEV